MKKVLILSTIITLFLVTAVAAATDQNVVMEIKGMTCEVCTVAVKKALSGVPGVKSVKVSFDEKKAWLVADKSVTDGMLNDALKKAGEYEGKVIERK
ncbi:MAG: heavy metal-associated domain-containing protein [Nitrospiraceae bacterium]|nr:heavy metal-associated domain-containing protein [Nitrospiraceae bacterium]